jgi:hypothetical protein
MVLGRSLVAEQSYERTKVKDLKTQTGTYGVGLDKLTLAALGH